MRSREMGKGRWGEGKRIDSCFPVSQSSCTFRSSGSGVLQRLRSLSISCLARLIVPAETSPVRSSSTNMRAMAKQSWWLRIHFRGIFSTRKPMAMQLGDGKHVFVTTNTTSTVALKFHSLSRGGGADSPSVLSKPRPLIAAGAELVHGDLKQRQTTRLLPVPHNGGCCLHDDSQCQPTDLD